MEDEIDHRIFLLSPAYAGGRRAQMILSERSRCDLAKQLRSKCGASIADVFTFLSGLYFRGKIVYANMFARPCRGMPGVFVITPTRGLVDAATRIRLDDLVEFATVDIHKTIRVIERLSSAMHGASQKRYRRGARSFCLGALLPGNMSMFWWRIFMIGCVFRLISSDAAT